MKTLIIAFDHTFFSSCSTEVLQFTKLVKSLFWRQNLWWYACPTSPTCLCLLDYPLRISTDEHSLWPVCSHTCTWTGMHGLSGLIKMCYPTVKGVNTTEEYMYIKLSFADNKDILYDKLYRKHQQQSNKLY